jgi:hypothetical protein
MENEIDDGSPASLALRRWAKQGAHQEQAARMRKYWADLKRQPKKLRKRVAHLREAGRKGGLSKGKDYGTGKSE